MKKNMYVKVKASFIFKKYKEIFFGGILKDRFAGDQLGNFWFHKKCHIGVGVGLILPPSSEL